MNTCTTVVLRHCQHLCNKLRRSLEGLALFGPAYGHVYVELKSDFKQTSLTPIHHDMLMPLLLHLLLFYLEIFNIYIAYSDFYFIYCFSVSSSDLATTLESASRPNDPLLIHGSDGTQVWSSGAWCSFNFFVPCT